MLVTTPGPCYTLGSKPHQSLLIPHQNSGSAAVIRIASTFSAPTVLTHGLMAEPCQVHPPPPQPVPYSSGPPQTCSDQSPLAILTSPQCLDHLRMLGLFLDTDYVQQYRLTTHPLSCPIPVYNVDGTLNEAGSICSVVDLVLHYQDHSKRSAFAITSLGKQDMILGFTWLHEHNPEIDWTKVKDTAWQWEPPQQAAFNTLKQSVTSKPVLLFPDNDSPFHVEADSSDFATGAVLSQQSKEDGKVHLVAFYSKSLNAVEWNYEIHDKEMLAIIQSFEEWRHFLEGAQHKFEVWTDHKNLEYFCSAKKLNQHQAWWSLYLANFDFSLHHKPGWSMGKPDALPRQADHGTGVGDNNNIVLLKPELFAIHALEGIVAQGDDANILRDIQ
ncbi:hypothetical protein E4T56_gene13773 [Termitomyces sp. T112]|nr:hypothetical protein E4T56_gene13773 [Termitomyces sp. T112]